jgi:hypothetical protein
MGAVCIDRSRNQAEIPVEIPQRLPVLDRFVFGHGALAARIIIA